MLVSHFNFNMENNTLLRKIIYWTLCTFLVIAIFILIGGYVAFIYDTNLNFNASLGLLIGLLGSIVVILALYKPHSLITPILLKKTPDDNANKKAISIWFTAIGFSFLIGGVVFSSTGNFELTIFFFVLPYILASILKAILKFPL